MSLRTACNHCNTPMKSRVKHQEIAGAPEDLRKTANMLPIPKANQGHWNRAPKGLRWSLRTELRIKWLFWPKVSSNQGPDLSHDRQLPIFCDEKCRKLWMSAVQISGSRPQGKFILIGRKMLNWMTSRDISPYCWFFLMFAFCLWFTLFGSVLHFWPFKPGEKKFYSGWSEHDG